MKAKLFKVGDGFFLQELPRKGSGGAVCERTLGSTWGEGDKLSIANCQSIRCGYNLDEMAENYAKQENSCYTNDYYGFKAGALAILEIIGDKKFTEKDMYEFATYTWKHSPNTEPVFLDKSFQKNEWDVEIVTEVIADEGFPIYHKPKLDADGCIILKKI